MRFTLLKTCLMILASCTPAGEPAGPSETAPGAAPADTATSTSSPAEATAEAPAEEPTQEPAAGAGVSGATLTIGDQTYSFDEVLFCTTESQNETVSFLLVAQQDGTQLSVQVNDPTGERRLQGDGVWDSIQLTEPPQTVEGFEVIPGWLANSQASGERFIVLDGDSVTASANFDDFAGEFAQVPGTLAATCP